MEEKYLKKPMTSLTSITPEPGSGTGAAGAGGRGLPALFWPSPPSFELPLVKLLISTTITILSIINRHWLYIIIWTHLAVYDPDPTLGRLHPLEVLVQGEVVADGVLNMENLIMTILRTLLSWSTVTVSTFQVAELLLKYADLSRNQL